MESSPSHIRAVAESGESDGDGGNPRLTSPDPGPLLSALREAAEHESAKEERLEGKTRGVVTVAGAYFAIVQTATFSASGTLGKLEGAPLHWTVGFALTAIVLLGIAIVAAVKQQWPRSHRSLPAATIGQDMLDLIDGKVNQREALHKLGGQYARVTKTRRDANDQRVRQYYEAGVFSLLAVIATSAELIVALVTRL